MYSLNVEHIVILLNDTPFTDIMNDLLEMKYGTLYPALMRLEQSGWISSEWGTSDNNRRARFYSITKQGRKQLALEAEGWEQMAAFITRVLGSTR